MKLSFKQWLAEDTTKAIGSDGSNSHPTKSAQAATKVAQGWLGKDNNASTAAKLASGSNPSTLNSKIMKAAADATDAAPATIANQTDATQVASAMTGAFGLKNTAFKPKFMRKK